MNVYLDFYWEGPQVIILLYLYTHIIAEGGETNFMCSTILEHMPDKRSERSEMLRILFIFDLLQGNIECSPLLAMLNIHAPSRTLREHDFLRLPNDGHRSFFNPFVECCRLGWNKFPFLLMSPPPPSQNFDQISHFWGGGKNKILTKMKFFFTKSGLLTKFLNKSDEFCDFA